MKFSRIASRNFPQDLKTRKQVLSALKEFIESIPADVWECSRDDFSYGYGRATPKDAGIRVTMNANPSIVEVFAFDAWNTKKNEFRTIDTQKFGIKATAKFVGRVHGGWNVYSNKEIEKAAEAVLRKNIGLVPATVSKAIEDLRQRLEAPEVRKKWRRFFLQSLKETEETVKKIRQFVD